MEKVRNYETTFILRPDMEEESREELLGKIKGIITDDGGEIVETDIWGSKKLEYEIQDYTSGYYVILNFNSSPEVINELERNFKIIGDVIRYLIVRIED